MTKTRFHTLIRPLVHELHAYGPGGQLQLKRLIKLNTYEDPYPPSPRVVRGTSVAGLTVDQHQLRPGVVESSWAALRPALPMLKRFAGLEGLGAHGKAAGVRQS